MTSGSVTFSDRNRQNHCSRTMSSAFTDDDWDAEAHCFDPTATVCFHAEL